MLRWADDRFKGVADKLGRVMDTVAVAIEISIKHVIGDPIGGGKILHKDMTGEVLRLAVKSRREREPQLMSKPSRGRAEREGHHDMDMIHAVERRCQDVPVRIRQRDAVFGYIRVQRSEIQCGNNIKVLLSRSLRVRAYDTHIVPLFPQGADQIHGGDGRTVILFPQHVTDYGYRHSQTLIFCLFQFPVPEPFPDLFIQRSQHTLRADLIQQFDHQPHLLVGQRRVS